MKVTWIKDPVSEPKTVTLMKVVEALKSERPRKAVRQFRELLPCYSPEQYIIEKEKIPEICFCSLYEKGSWKGYTGLILIEFKHVGTFRDACRLRERIALLKEPLLAFVGADGRSVKVVVRYLLPDDSLPVTQEEARRFHALAYKRATLHYEEQFNRKVSKSEALLETKCRLSWDPECFVNLNSTPVYLDQPESLPGRDEGEIDREIPFDPVREATPGIEQVNTISYLFENCLKKAYEVKGVEWEEDDPKSFIHLMGGYCRDAGIPEENTVRWIYSRQMSGQEMDLVRITIRNVYAEKQKKSTVPELPRIQKMIYELCEFMKRRFNLRYNELKHGIEYKQNIAYAHTYEPVNKTIRNFMCMEARKEGIDAWDKDIERYLDSPEVERYNPLGEFFNSLPLWDGEDRIRELARTVPTNDTLWPDHFYVWFMSMVTHWNRKDTMYANSLVPVLSGGQGISKSVFFRRLLPPALQEYYIEHISLDNPREAELLMSQNLLINLDEFDRLNERYQAVLKNLIQKPVLKIKRPYQKSYEMIRRLASFSATANPFNLLTDPTGSRRYICVQVKGAIDITYKIDYPQLYAQAMYGYQNGVRYWLNTEEEQRLMQANAAFLDSPQEIEYLFSWFRIPEEGENAQEYTSAQLLDIITRRSGRKFTETSKRKFSHWLIASGVSRRHTYKGNVYSLVPLFRET